jgi:hypothetical protein
MSCALTPRLPCSLRSTVPLPSHLYPVRGVIPPSYTPAITSLPAQAAHVASLAQIPAAELEVRKHTDHFRPLLSKEGLTVYLEKRGGSSAAHHNHQHAPVGGGNGYVLRPNFRQLHESDDPANHRALTYVTTVPPSLQHSFGASHSAVPDPTLASRKPRGKSQGQHPQQGGVLGDKLIFLRAPKRGAEEERRKAAKLAKERQDDYDSAGLKPRPIKSVAALLNVASPGKKPTHLRLTSIPRVGAGGSGEENNASTEEKQFLTSPIAFNGANLARFTKALKLPTKPASSSGVAPPPAILVPSPEVDLLADQPSTPVDDSMRTFPAEGDSSAGSGAAGEEGKKEAVVVAAEQGATCCICTSSDFVDPWISQCQHVCCSECWMQYLQEDPTCPECSVPVNVEELRPIVLCNICTRIPQQPWTAECGHTACNDCWRMYLSENPVCSECNQPIDIAQLPPAIE